MNKRLLILAFFLAFVISNCSNLQNGLTGSLELKTKSEKQELNQVRVIGTRFGEIPPDFTVVTTEGKAARLSDLMEQKKPIIVYFMATWCPWCAKDYTALSKVYEDYKNNITIVSISLDLSEDLLELKEYKKKYPKLQSMMLAPGQEQILIDYGITKTTTKYAIGRNGTIVYKTIGVFEEEQWKQLFDILLG